MPDGIPVTRSSGNVFADMGFENGEKQLLKAELTLQIRKAIRDKDPSRQAAARLTGVSERQATMPALTAQAPGTGRAWAGRCRGDC